MHKLMVFSAIVLAGFLVTACDDRKSPVPGPTPFDNAGVSADVTAGAPLADPGGDRGCAAFAIPVELALRAGDTALSITDVRVGFEPGSGITMPQVTQPAPIPTKQFGSDLIAARSVLTIPLRVPIGCIRDHNGTVIVIVGMRDARGHTRSVEIRTRVS